VLRPTDEPAFDAQAPKVTAEDPSTGIDWEKWWDDPSNKLSVVRVPLEVLRMYPGYGLLFGGAADIINVYQDFSALSGEDAPFIKLFIGIRSALLIINNAVGHLIYIDQLVQDGLAVSVVGIEFTPLTAFVNDLLKLLKIYLDAWMGFLDFGITCGALYRASKAPPGSESQKTFAALVGSYAANTLVDLTNGIIDVIDIATSAVSNGEVIKTGVNAINAILKGAIKLSPIIRSILIGWAGIFGGIPLTPDVEPAPDNAGAAPAAGELDGAPPLARRIQRLVADGSAKRLGKRALAEIILMELRRMKLAYTTGDMLLGAAGDLLSDMIAQITEAATAANDGKDPFITARDAGHQALRELGERIGEYAQIEALSMSGAEWAAQVSGMADGLLAAVDALKVPDVTIPESDLGDGLLADAAESVLNAAGDLASAGLQALVDQVNGLIEAFKPPVRDAIDGLKVNATEVGDFMAIVAEQARQQIVWAQEKSDEIATKLGQCENFEDFINLIISQALQMAGMDAEFKVDDVRKGWAQLGREIDAAIVWAEGMRAAAAAEGEDESGGGG
jgi:hypothetical protein